MQNELTALRNAVKRGADEHNWEVTKTQVTTVFERLSSSDVAVLALDYIKLYLPRFLEINPEERWVEDRLTSVSSVLNGELKPEDLPGYPDYTRKLIYPLARSFRSAVGSVWTMAKYKPNSPRFAENATDAISIIISILAYEYRDWIPPQYEHLRSEGKSNQEYWGDLWNNLVDKLENFLPANDNSPALEN